MTTTSQSAGHLHTRTAQLFNIPEERFSVIWDTEKWWVDHQPWLETRGYMLRPRYRPGWVPSWYASGTFEAKWHAEDRKPMPVSGPSIIRLPRFRAYAHCLLQYAFILDATRVADGAFVMLKRVDKRRHPTEVQLTSMLHSPPYAADPRNHCVPALEVLQDPNDENIQLLVMPLLRRYANPRFDTVGEAVVCFRQIIQVRGCAHQSLALLTLRQCVRFLHANKIAHRYVPRRPSAIPN